MDRSPCSKQPRGGNRRRYPTWRLGESRAAPCRHSEKSLYQQPLSAWKRVPGEGEHPLDHAPVRDPIHPQDYEGIDSYCQHKGLADNSCLRQVTSAAEWGEKWRVGHPEVGPMRVVSDNRVSFHWAGGAPVDGPNREEARGGHLGFILQLCSGTLGSIWNMPLSAGERLGPYEILSPIGAGGMGEVY